MLGLPVCDITPLTLQDFPGKIACILWFMGCSMRCVYCHNPRLVYARLPRLPWGQIEDFLKKRQGVLDGVVLTGGECTLSPQLPALIKKLRKWGYLVKLDTNGLSPSRLESLLDEQLIDYVALDYKAPESVFHRIVQKGCFDDFVRSLRLLIASKISFEVRTTVPMGLLNESNINEMARHLHHEGYTGEYYLQRVQQGVPTLSLIPPQEGWLDFTQLQALPGVIFKERLSYLL